MTPADRISPGEIDPTSGAGTRATATGRTPSWRSSAGSSTSSTGRGDLGCDPEWLAHVDIDDPDHDPGVPERLLQQLRDPAMRVEPAFPRERFESFVAAPETRSTVVGLLDTGNADVYLLDRSITAYVARHGERAVFDVPSADEGPVVRLTTTQPPVLDWVDSTVERFRERATSLTRAELTERRPPRGSVGASTASVVSQPGQRGGILSLDS